MTSELQQLADTTKMLLSQGGTTESCQGNGPINDAELTEAVADLLKRSRVAAVFEHDEGEADRLESLTARNLVLQAREALNKVQGGTSASNLADEDVSALEVIVHAVGRPALRFRKGSVETPTNSIADNARWYLLVAMQREKINRISSRVGRITSQNGVPYPVFGTGWSVAPGLIITNRHVAQFLMVEPAASDPKTWTIDQTKTPFVDFSYTDETPGPVIFHIKELVYCDTDIDLALLRIELGNAAQPPPIAIDWRKQALGRELPAAGNAQPVFQGVEVYAVGHPYRLSATPEIESIFGQVDGRKRWAPGLVTAIDSPLRSIRHDCSTLGGNSGSCVVSTESTDHAAVGLHFGGQEGAGGRGSGFGPTNYAIAFAQIENHPAARFLK
jgi:hypothetical protein